MKQFFVVVAVVLAATLSSHAEIKADGNEKIKEYPLPEVEVLSIKTKTRIVGRMSNNGSMLLKVEGVDGAGKEVGLQFKTKKKAWVKRVSFAIVESDSMLSRMPFRLNLYKQQGNEYINKFVSPIEFLYTKEAIVDGRFAFELPLPLALEKGEYVIAIEFLENFPNHKFQMRTGIMTGTTYNRDRTNSSWSKIPLGSTMAVELIEER